MKNELKVVQRGPQDDLLLKLNEFISQGDELIREAKALRGPGPSPAERLKRGEKFREKVEVLLRVGEPLEEKLKDLSRRMTVLQNESDQVENTLEAVAKRDKELARAEKSVL